MTGKTVILLMGSYLLGCINTGYYYSLLVYRKDIREVGTGVTGAMNVSRLAGKKGFILTFLGDALKGLLVPLLCRSIQAEEWVLLLCMLMVLIGHILPVQLHFRGGKGLSTLFGALLGFHPVFVFYLFLTCAVIFPFVRRYTISSLYALLIFPLELFLLDYSYPVIGFSAACSGLILLACRSNIKEYLKDKAYNKK